MYFQLCRVFLAVHGLPLVAVLAGAPFVSMHRLLTVLASFVAEHRLWRMGFSSCNMWVQ